MILKTRSVLDLHSFVMQGWAKEKPKKAEIRESGRLLLCVDLEARLEALPLYLNQEAYIDVENHPSELHQPVSSTESLLSCGLSRNLGQEPS